MNRKVSATSDDVKEAGRKVGSQGVTTIDSSTSDGVG